MGKAIAFICQTPTVPPERVEIRWGAVLPAPTPYEPPDPKALSLTGATPYWPPRWYDVRFDGNLNGNRFLQAWINVLSSGGGAKKSDEIGKMLALLGLVPVSAPPRTAVRFGAHVSGGIPYIPSGGKELRLVGPIAYVPPDRDAITFWLIKRVAVDIAVADTTGILRVLAEADVDLFADLMQERMRAADFLAWAKVARAVNAGNVLAAFDTERAKNVADVAALLWIEQEGATDMAADLSACNEAANDLMADLARAVEASADSQAWLRSYQQGDAGTIEAGMDVLRDKAVADLVARLAGAAERMADLFADLARETEAHADVSADLGLLQEGNGDILAVARGMRQAGTDLETVARLAREGHVADVVTTLLVAAEVAGADILTVAAIVNAMMASADVAADLAVLRMNGADLRSLARFYQEEATRTNLVAAFPWLRPRAGEDDWGTDTHSDLALTGRWPWKHAQAHLLGDLVWRIFDITRWDVNIDLAKRIVYRRKGTLFAMLRTWHAARFISRTEEADGWQAGIHARTAIAGDGLTIVADGDGKNISAWGFRPSPTLARSSVRFVPEKKAIRVSPPLDLTWIRYANDAVVSWEELVPFGARVSVQGAITGGGVPGEGDWFPIKPPRIPGPTITVPAVKGPRSDIRLRVRPDGIGNGHALAFVSRAAWTGETPGWAPGWIGRLLPVAELPAAGDLRGKFFWLRQVLVAKDETQFPAIRWLNAIVTAKGGAASDLVGRLGKKVPRSQQARTVVEILDRESGVAILSREGTRHVLLRAAERGILTREAVAEILKRLGEVE